MRLKLRGRGKQLFHRHLPSFGLILVPMAYSPQTQTMRMQILVRTMVFGISEKNTAILMEMASGIIFVSLPNFPPIFKILLRFPGW
jgi:hypothetical protein